MTNYIHKDSPAVTHTKWPRFWGDWVHIELVQSLRAHFLLERDRERVRLVSHKERKEKNISKGTEISQKIESTFELYPNENVVWPRAAYP